MRMKKWQICLVVSFIFSQQINAQVQTKKLILLSTAKSLDIETEYPKTSLAETRGFSSSCS